MIHLGLLAMCVAFVEFFRLLRLGSHVGVTLEHSREALAAVKSTDLTDLQKETIMRRCSLALLKTTGAFTAKFLLLALGMAVLFFVLAALLRLPREEFLGMMLSPLIIVAMTAAATCYVWIRNVIAKRL